MKIRSDFVTNSSSSSFILSFKDEDSIYKTLKEQFPKDIKEGWSAGDTGYLYQLLSEIEETERLTQNDLIDIVDRERWSIRWLLKEKLEEEKNMSYLEINDYFKSDEGRKMIDDAYEKQLKEILQKIGDDKVIVEVNHGDGGEGEDGILEHKILPKLDCTVIRFSHH